QNYSGCGTRLTVVISGTLYFSGGSKLRMPCSSNFYVLTNGAVDSDASGNSNQIEICGTTYWNGSSGTLTGPSCIPPNQPPCSVILPIRIIFFKGKTCSYRQTCLTWATASEKNSSYFEISRSENGVDFEIIAKVPVKATNGNSQFRL